MPGHFSPHRKTTVISLAENERHGDGNGDLRSLENYL
jgi:hypothetical protein